MSCSEAIEPIATAEVLIRPEWVETGTPNCIHTVSNSEEQSCNLTFEEVKLHPKSGYGVTTVAGLGIEWEPCVVGHRIVSAQQQQEDEEFKVILWYKVAWRPAWQQDTLY